MDRAIFFANIPTPDVIAGCYGKQGYKNKALAKDIARATVRRDSSANLNVYRCANCNLHHIGTRSTKQ